MDGGRGGKGLGGGVCDGGGSFTSRSSRSNMLPQVHSESLKRLGYEQHVTNLRAMHRGDRWMRLLGAGGAHETHICWLLVPFMGCGF